MKKVLRGALVAGVAFAACVGFGASASAAESDRAEVPDVSSTDVDILNNACILPWFWQGPFNVLVENQDGSYSACNAMPADDAEGIDIGNNACILPWFWQGPFNVLLGSQYGEYEACNGDAVEIPMEAQEKLLDLLPDGTGTITEQQLLDLLPEGTELLPMSR